MGISRMCARKQHIKSRSGDETWYKLENNICTKATGQNELRLCEVQGMMEHLSSSCCLCLGKDHLHTGKVREGIGIRH